MRAMERALRRSGLPLYMTEGFNPHPKLAILWPTSVGETSQQDFLEVEISERIDATILREGLAAQLPPALQPGTVEALAGLKPTAVESVEYDVTPPEGTRTDPAQIHAALAADRLPIERKRAPKSGGPTKIIDIRPYVISVSSGDGKIHLHLKVTNEGTARPSEVIRALGHEHQDTLLWKIDRRRVHLAKAS
jgi:radical SAM-linked protein